MNYVYDILLNFNENLYDFYDWNVRDLIFHMRKIPIFKVNKEVIEDFLNYEIVLDDEFKDKIKDKSEMFYGRKINNIKYSFLLTDSKKVLAFKLKDNKLLVSDLLIDEEEVALETVPLLTIYNIKYKKYKKKSKLDLKTRKELEIENSLKKSINYLKEENNIGRLKYIYYECFNKKINSVDKIIIDFNKELSNEIITKINKILNLKINSSKNV